MKHQMFVIYDSKANAYMQPWFLTQTAMAQRAFMDCVNDKKHNFGMHPEDYTLFNIGTFDDSNANVKWQTPQTLGNGLEYIRPEQDDDQTDLFETLKTGQDPDNLPLRGHDGEGK